MVPKVKKNLKAYNSGAGRASNPGSSKSSGFPSKADLRGGTVETSYSAGPSDGKLHLYFLPYCEDMGVYGSPFSEGKGVCCLMKFAQRPSPLFNFRVVAGKYASAMSEERDFPKTVEGLENLYQYKFVYSDGEDFDNTGLTKKNSIAMFMNLTKEVMMDFVLMLEDLIAWRVNSYDGDTEPVQIPIVVVHNGTNIEMKLDDDVETTCKTEFAEGVDSDVRVTEVPPPVYPKRFVVIQFESDKETHVDLTIKGNLKPYANALAQKRVPMKIFKVNPEDVYPEKFYTLHDFKITEEESKLFVLNDLLVEAFGKCPVVLNIKGDGFKGAASELLDRMKGLDFVHG